MSLNPDGGFALRSLNHQQTSDTFLPIYSVWQGLAMGKGPANLWIIK
jgi:hypothetical protein